MDSSRQLVHTAFVSVRWGDMDAMVHLNNTVYFRFMEQARVEWLEKLGYRVNLARSEAAVIVNASCTFLVPITYPATVEVRMFLGSPGRSSLPSYYELRYRGEDRLCAEGAAKIVWVNSASGQSLPLPDAIRLQLQS